MEIEDLHKISEAKGLEYYGGDGDWFGDPYYKGPNEPREIMVKYGGDDTADKKFTDPEEALQFCASLDCTYALWHGHELVIAFTKD